MGKIQFFANPSNTELAIEASRVVANKIQSYLLPETKLISKADFEEIQTENAFIAKYGDAPTQYDYAKDLLGFVKNSKGTCNEGFIVTLYRDFINSCPPQILSELKSYSTLNSTIPAKTS